MQFRRETVRHASPSHREVSEPQLNTLFYAPTPPLRLSLITRSQIDLQSPRLDKRAIQGSHRGFQLSMQLQHQGTTGSGET